MGESLRPHVDSHPRPAGHHLRWSPVVPYRERLLRLAHAMGAGPDSEDVVHEALLAAAQYEKLDEGRVWPLLANIVAKRVADRYRRIARAQILIRHRALVPRPRSFEHDLVDRAEAGWMASQLAKRLPSEIMEVLLRRHVGGDTWAELAAQRHVAADTLQKQVRRALVLARRRIAL